MNDKTSKTVISNQQKSAPTSLSCQLLALLQASPELFILSYLVYNQSIHLILNLKNYY